MHDVAVDVGQAEGELLVIQKGTVPFSSPLPFDAWADTTTPSIRIYRGHAQEAEEHDAELHTSGILKIYIQDFLR